MHSALLPVIKQLVEHPMFLLLFEVVELFGLNWNWMAW